MATENADDDGDDAGDGDATITITNNDIAKW